MARIGFIGVSYNTNSRCEQLVRSFALSYGDALEIFIVNNSAQSEQDSSLDGLRQLSPRITIINAPWNPGYFGGGRLVLKRINPGDYDWIVVANVDIIISDNKFWDKLSALSVGRDVGVVAPSLISTLTNSESNPFMSVRPSSSRMRFYRYAFSSFFSSWLFHVGALLKYRLKKLINKNSEAKENTTEEIYAAHGAFLIFSKEYFLRGGNLDHGAYMYGEEIFVAETCARLKLRSIFVPSLRVFHIERESTGLVYSRKVLSWKKASSFYLWKEFFSE